VLSFCLWIYHQLFLATGDQAGHHMSWKLSFGTRSQVVLEFLDGTFTLFLYKFLVDENMDCSHARQLSRPPSWFWESASRRSLISSSISSAPSSLCPPLTHGPYRCKWLWRTGSADANGQTKIGDEKFKTVA
jgi:hypothetical protein